MKSPTIVYVKWRDACRSEDDHQIADLGDLYELEEVGFLLKETDESITIGIEHPGEASFARLWLTIPRVNIVEMKKRTVAQAFPSRKRKVTA